MIPWQIYLICNLLSLRGNQCILKGLLKDISQICILIGILVLAVIALLVLVIGKKGKEKRLTLLASLASGFVLAGLFFVENRWIGYALMGICVILSVIDMFKKGRAK